MIRVESNFQNPQENEHRKTISRKRADLENLKMELLGKIKPYHIAGRAANITRNKEMKNQIYITKTFLNQERNVSERLKMFTEMKKKLNKITHWERIKKENINCHSRPGFRSKRKKSWEPTDPNSSIGKAFKRSKNNKAINHICLDIKEKEIKEEEYKFFKWSINALQNVNNDNEYM
jgi:hypothetical protein